MRKNYDHILFDLDGTLVDSRPGIVSSAMDVFKELELPPPPREQILIGPPILETVRAFLGDHNSHLFKKAIDIYRQAYSDRGVFECALYPGVLDILQAGRGKKKFHVVTLKATVFAQKMLDHLQLSSFFESIHGMPLTDTAKNKAFLLKDMLSNHGIDPASAVLIGDTSHDANAARANGVDFIGVTWGYEFTPSIDSSHTTVHTLQDLSTLLDIQVNF